MKRCPGCGETKVSEEFAKDKHNKDGLKSRCRECSSSQFKTWRNNNTEYNRARVKLWREENLERAREYDRVYGANNLERKSEYRRQHGERIRESSRLRYQADPERARERQRRWVRENLEKARALSRASSNLRRARKKATCAVDFTVQQLDARWEYYANKCWMCGEGAAVTDHVKPLAKGGAHMLCNLRPACWSCNAHKKDKWPLTKVAA